MFGFRRGSREAMHRFCRENLSAFLDGELAAREREVVEQHLQQCQECRWNLQTLEHTVSLLHKLPPVKAPRSFRIPHSVPAPAVPFWMRPWTEGALRVATAATTVLLVVALAGNALALPAATSQRAAYAINQEAVPAAKAADGTGIQALAATAPSAGQESEAARENWLPSTRGTQPGPVTVLTPPFAPWDSGVEQTPNATPLSPEEATRAAAAPRGLGGGGTEPTTPTPGPGPTELPKGAASVGTPGATEAPQLALASPPTVEEGAREDSVAQPEAAQDLQPAQAVPQQSPLWQQVRQRMTGYPWREVAIAAGGLLAVLLVATLWLRMVRARWS